MDGPLDLGLERWLVIDMLLKRPMPERRYSIVIRTPSDIAAENRAGLRLSTRSWLNRSRSGVSERWIGQKTPTSSVQRCIRFRSAFTQWRRGRLLLAGDAAHLTPPFGKAGHFATQPQGWLDAYGTKSILMYETERKPRANLH